MAVWLQTETVIMTVYQSISVHCFSYMKPSTLSNTARTQDRYAECSLHLRAIVGKVGFESIL